jgi:Flp pilus assembly protein TadG
VEFAILLPLLAALLFGVIEASLLMYDKMILTSASREGARFGSLYRPTRPTCGEIYTGAVQAYEADLFAWNIAGRGHATTITVNCLQCDSAGACSAGVCPDTPAGERLAVETVFSYGFFELLTQITGPITLRATTIMNCE